MFSVPAIVVEDVRRVALSQGRSVGSARGEARRASGNDSGLFVPWQELERLLEELECSLGGGEALRRASRELVRFKLLSAGASERMLDPKLFYHAAIQSVGPLLCPGATIGHAMSRDGTYEQYFEFSMGFSPPSAFFHYLQGALESAPNYVPLPSTTVTFDIFGSTAVLRYSFGMPDNPQFALSPQALARVSELLEVLRSILERTQRFPSNFSKRVGQDIDRHLGTGEIQLAGVAARFGMSERSLKRRLKQDGTSFRSVRDARMQKRALDLLREGEIVDNVATELGFSDARTFRRAFRRWTGSAPSAIREQFSSERSPIDESARSSPS